MTDAPVRVALVQLASGADPQANLAHARREILAAARAGARVVVLPEYAAAFDPRGVGADLAEAPDGPFVTALRELSASRGLTLVAGAAFPGRKAGRAVNAVIVVADGEHRATYAKVHLYDAFGHRESDRLEPGDPAAPPVVVDVAGLRLGIQTCYDLRFPEVSRRLVDAGATVLVVPAAWAAGPGKLEQWRVLARARAIESTSAVLAVGQAGRGVVGHSMAIDASGVVLGELGGDAGTLVADLDPAAIARVRERNPSLANRRYGVVPLPAPSTDAPDGATDDGPADKLSDASGA